MKNKIANAVAHYWQIRNAQREKQKKREVSDAGLRGAVTGGAQMDGFTRLFTDMIVDAGIDERHVFRKRLLELPGFFRRTNQEKGDILYFCSFREQEGMRGLESLS